MPLERYTCSACMVARHEDCIGKQCDCFFCKSEADAVSNINIFVKDKSKSGISETCSYCSQGWHTKCVGEQKYYPCKCQLCAEFRDMGINNSISGSREKGKVTTYNGTGNTYGGTYGAGYSYSSCKHDGNDNYDFAFAVKFKGVDHKTLFLGSKRDYATDNVLSGEKALIVNGYGTKVDVKPPIVFCNIPGDARQRLDKFSYLASVEEICLDWKDQAPPPVGFDFWLELIKIIAERKYAKVICCCMGGHGRTGTALTSLYLATHADNSPRNAVNVIRRTYCGKAVESQSQADYINKMVPYYESLNLARLKPLVPPPKREKKTTVASTNTTVIGDKKCDVCGEVKPGVLPTSVGDKKEIYECTTCWNKRTNNGSNNSIKIPQEIIDKKYPPNTSAQESTSATLAAAAASQRYIAAGVKLSKKERRALRKTGQIPGKEICACGIVYDSQDRGASCTTCGHLIGFDSQTCTCTRCLKENPPKQVNPAKEMVRCGKEGCGLLFPADQPRCPRCANNEKAQERISKGESHKTCPKCRFVFFPLAQYPNRETCFSCDQMTQDESKSLRDGVKKQIGFIQPTEDDPTWLAQTGFPGA